MSVEVRMLTTQVQFRDPSHWLFDHAKSGGGILSWLGCHHIDLMHYITGDEIVSVAAEVATRSPEGIDVEDVAVLSLRFRSGAVGSLHTGYTLALSGGGYHNKSGYDTYVGFNGRGGRIYWASSGAPTALTMESTRPEWSSAPRRMTEYTQAVSPAYGGVAGEVFVRRFIQAAQGEGEPMASGSDALRVARVVDAAYESNRTGRRIDIEIT
jgi:predicted dehydrogenase